VFTDGTTSYADAVRSVGYRNLPTDPFTWWRDLVNGRDEVSGVEAVFRSSLFTDSFTVLHFSVYLTR
jgi:hypothetical protein